MSKINTIVVSFFIDNKLHIGKDLNETKIILKSLTCSTQDINYLNYKNCL